MNTSTPSTDDDGKKKTGLSLDGDNTQRLLDKESHAHQQYLDKQEKDFQLKIQERQFDHEDKLKEKELGWLG